mmetsp:Transcript_20291/g.61133  ORF Transcript_20291/g.61133 Transcript_20291/m.61133 type:complete len:226 (-) Transcript_20291:2807-3484(-)
MLPELLAQVVHHLTRVMYQVTAVVEVVPHLRVVVVLPPLGWEVHESCNVAEETEAITSLEVHRAGLLISGPVLQSRSVVVAPHLEPLLQTGVLPHGRPLHIGNREDFTIGIPLGIYCFIVLLAPEVLLQLAPVAPQLTVRCNASVGEVLIHADDGDPAGEVREVEKVGKRGGQCVLVVHGARQVIGHHQRPPEKCRHHDQVLHLQPYVVETRCVLLPCNIFDAFT